MQPGNLKEFESEGSVTGKQCIGPEGRNAIGKPWAERLYALFEIIICTGITTTLLAQLAFEKLGFGAGKILSSAKLTTTFILLESTLLLGLIILLQRVRAESVWDLGFAAASYVREVRIGLAVLPLLFLVNFLVTQSFRLFWPQWLSKENPLLGLIKTPSDLALFILVSVMAGGVKEELQRAFILQRFRKYLSMAAAGVIIWSIAFGVGHAMQGYDSALGAAIYGVIFGLVYFWRNSLVAPMVAHALYDVSVLTGYWFWGLQ